MDMAREDMAGRIKKFLFSVAVGFLSGAAALSSAMLIAAFCAVRIGLALSAYTALSWLPVEIGGFAAGFAAGLAAKFAARAASGHGEQGRLSVVCGLMSAAVLWLALTAVSSAPGAGELIRGAAMLAAGAVGVCAAGKRTGKRRTRYKPGKVRARSSPRTRPF